jgi:hypothetical protein
MMGALKLGLEKIEPGKQAPAGGTESPRAL